MRAQSCAASASAGVSQEPPTQATLGSARNSRALPGVTPPVGQKRTLPTVLDDTAYGFGTVYVSGGRRGFDIGLSPADLITVTNARTAAIAR